MSGRLVLRVALCVLALGACGGTGANYASGETGPSGLGTVVADHWHAVIGAPADTELHVVIIASPASLPPGDRCYEKYSAADTEATDSVSVTLHQIQKAPDGCTQTTRSAVIPLHAPLGSRAVVDTATSDRYVRGPGAGYYLQPNVPVSIAGPRETCSETSYETAVTREIDGHQSLSDERCDGTFLIMNVAQHRAYFVNRNRSWRIVTYGTGITCAEVAADTGIHFPSALCSGGAG